MSETLAHTKLVGIIVEWIKGQHSATPGFCLFCDCPTVLNSEKPAPIEGFFPDVCAVTTPLTLTIIGEAKTLLDLESPRSYRQLQAFLRYLAVRPEPILLIATPWQGLMTAKQIVARAKRECSAEKVAVRFLTDQQAS